MIGGMPVNSTHADYDAALPGWIRARDLLAGEDAVKAVGEKYLRRLEAQSDDEYKAYQSRACFFHATRRAADAFVGLVKWAPRKKVAAQRSWAQPGAAGAVRTEPMLQNAVLRWVDAGEFDTS